MDIYDWVAMLAKLVFIVFVLMNVAPIMAWVERRGSALMQNRLGPNRLGPFGIFQSIADAVKFMFKEDRIPAHVEKFYWLIAPIISLIPALMAFAVIPFASTLALPDGRVISFQVADLNVGLLYVFAIGSLGVYGIIMGGWSANNKYALLGSLRSSSQMISYELSMGLSIIPMIMLASSVNLMDIVKAQGEMFSVFGLFNLPKWGIFVQPLGCLIFTTALFAETNRLPFDLPEGESEIVAGYHLEYGSMKFAMLMMSEYISMTTASAMIATLFLGGWQMLPGMPWLLEAVTHWAGWSGLLHECLRVVFEMVSFFVKVGALMWVFVWVRWTLPRFRYDQLMNLGWKVMLPLSLVNILATGAVIYYLR